MRRRTILRKESHYASPGYPVCTFVGNPQVCENVSRRTFTMFSPSSKCLADCILSPATGPARPHVAALRNKKIGDRVFEAVVDAVREFGI
jgi:hypothetical protein